MKPRKRPRAGSGRCVSGKTRFRDHEEAVNVLAKAVTARSFGSDRRREVRVYECELCAGFHVTSQAKRVAGEPA